MGTLSDTSSSRKCCSRGSGASSTCTGSGHHLFSFRPAPKNLKAPVVLIQYSTYAWYKSARLGSVLIPRRAEETLTKARHQHDTSIKNLARQEAGCADRRQREARPLCEEAHAVEEDGELLGLDGDAKPIELGILGVRVPQRRLLLRLRAPVHQRPPQRIPARGGQAISDLLPEVGAALGNPIPRRCKAMLGTCAVLHYHPTTYSAPTHLLADACRIGLAIVFWRFATPIHTSLNTPCCLKKSTGWAIDRRMKAAHRAPSETSSSMGPTSAAMSKRRSIRANRLTPRRKRPASRRLSRRGASLACDGTGLHFEL